MSYTVMPACLTLFAHSVKAVEEMQDVRAVWLAQRSKAERDLQELKAIHKSLLRTTNTITSSIHQCADCKYYVIDRGQICAGCDEYVCETCHVRHASYFQCKP